MQSLIEHFIRVIIVCLMILTIGMICGAVSAEEPKKEMSESVLVMVMSDNFDVQTGKVNFIVMDWNGNDEGAAKAAESMGRSAKMNEIWLASVPLEAVAVREMNGPNGFDWGEVNKLNGKGECSKFLLKVPRKVDLDFWNEKLARYKKECEVFLSNSAPPPMTEAEDSFPFAKIQNYPSEDFVVVREFIGMDKPSGSMKYKSREVKLDGFDVSIRTDAGWWNSVRCVGKLEIPKNADIAGRYEKATILVPFAERHSLTRHRESFEKWKMARELYKIDHPSTGSGRN